MANRVSVKHLQIDKANRSLVLISAVCAMVFAFSIVGSRALLSQRSYQGRVIKEKDKAVKQLKANLEATQKLVAAYQSFINTQENIIGGTVNAEGDRDGDNAKIVLDALPSRYDFPALATSLEKILSEGGYRINNIIGTDDELNQQAAATSNAPVEIPFQISVGSNYESSLRLLDVLDRSIRPFHVDSVSLGGTTQDLTILVSAKTFYQPEKSLLIEMKEVK